MIGLLCPGQGAQHVGMGRDLADTFAVARDTFEEADEVLGTRLSVMCWDGPEAELTQTHNAQPAILVHTVAAWRVLTAETGTSFAIAAGHSLGEFSAFVAAGSISFADAVRLVRIRGELMRQAGTERPGAMAAVLGLEDAPAEAACRAASERSGGTVVPANYNSPGQIVVSGDAGAVAMVQETAREMGAKRVIPLNVSGAFHSPLMMGAEAGLRDALSAVDFGDPSFPVVSNVTAQAVHAGPEARELLLRQLTSPVRWVESVRTMVELGVGRFIEVGPSNVLSGLVRRIERAVEVEAVGTPADLDRVLAYGSGRG